MLKVKYIKRSIFERDTHESLLIVFSCTGNIICNEWEHYSSVNHISNVLVDLPMVTSCVTEYEVITLWIDIFPIILILYISVLINDDIDFVYKNRTLESNLQWNYFTILVLQKFRYFFAQHFQQKAHKQDITTINPKSTIYHIINWLSYFSPFICLVVYIQGASPTWANCNLYPF